MKHRLFNSKWGILFCIFALLILFAAAALLRPYPYSQLFKKDDTLAIGTKTIDVRYMSEVTGVEAPQDMQRQYKRHPDEYKFAIDDDLVVMFAYPDSDIRWVGMVFIHHFPSVSEVVLDFDGNTIYEEITSPEVQAQMNSFLNDNSFIARLQNQMKKIWAVDDPGMGVLDLVDSLQGDGFQVEFLGGRPQTLFDAGMFLIRVNDQDINVYEFADETTRRTVSDNISPDGYELTQPEGENTKIIHIEYMDQPNFWAKENLLVQYLGQDRSTIVLLSSLLGDSITHYIVDETDICNLSPIPDILFPRQEPVEGIREVMEAELVGDLVLENGCIQVLSLYNDGSYLPIWPSDFKLVQEDGVIVILDGNGNEVAQVGEEVYMGGGTGSSSVLPDCVHQELSGNCEGTIWIVGEGVRLNLTHGSDLINLEVIEFDERSVILITKKPVLDEWVDETSAIAGKLVLYESNRCTRLRSESGISDYLLIWPPDYALQHSDGVLKILNGSGDVVAQEGEEVVLHGGAIPHSWDSEQYRRLYYNIPGDCYGPYWVVIE